MYFTVNCKDQDGVDYYWDRLTDGGHRAMLGMRKIVVADLEKAAAVESSRT